ARAGEVGGELALLLVVTDRPPPEGLVTERGRVRWWAFGEPRPNLAFVHAARSAREGGDRCLLEVANLGPDPRSAGLTVEVGSPPRPWRRYTLELAPWATRQTVLTLEEGAGPVRARLGADELVVDNEVTLLPVARRAVGVAVRLEDPALRDLVER